MECPAPCHCGLMVAMASSTWKPVASGRGPFQITYALLHSVSPTRGMKSGLRSLNRTEGMLGVPGKAEQ